MTTKKQAKPNDLAAFDEVVKRQEEGVDVPILGPDGKTPLGFSIKVAGPDSSRAQQANEEMTDELIEAENLSRPSAREAAQRGLRYLAKVTIGWSPSVVMDGQELSCSEEHAFALYQRFKFIKEQVDKAAGSRARFTKG